nr:ankyrin repeat and LEM domain-containing protein 2-like [Onthophagus taurus]XP_022911169.1 ankyrin repeat and LEM domain-containing protein 2-like [Onthophagus taurus]
MDHDKEVKLKTDSNHVYYGVHVPNLVETLEEVEKTNVFTDKAEALKLVKQFKKARFKCFNYYHEAVEFATHGGDTPFINNHSFNSNSKKEPENENLSCIVNEKCQFRGPKSQDLIKLRKAIETNDLNYVEKTVWDNPRYLISSGDTPSILQEGSRYNALHIAAKSKHSDMCELILNTVGNVDFIEKLYGEDEHQNSEDRVKILLDLYLNTPDKGVNETPLHFAVKFGALKVVEVLVSYPQCDKNVRNKYGKLPNQVVCERYEGYAEKLKEQISNLLEDNFYVPVLRYEGNCTPPVIGEPFSPKSPPSFDVDPFKPRLEIHAYAGPMEKKEADKFRKIWKTPPRSISKQSFDRKRRLSNSLDSDFSYNLKLRDPEKGLETVGRELATKYNVNWKEYWPFLDDFVDLCSDDGLKRFETFLSQKVDTNFSNHNSPKRLVFETKPADNSNNSTMESLCRKLESMCILDDSSIILNENPDFVCPYVCLERSLKIFATRISNVLKKFNNFINFQSSLTAEIKLFEQLIVSYVDDKRFVDVNMQKSHHRLAVLIASGGFLTQEIQIKITEILTLNLEINKHLECVLKNVLSAPNHFTTMCEEENSQKMWENTEECCCIFVTKPTKLKYSLRRKNNGVKTTGNANNNSYFNNVSKSLFKVKNSNLKNDDLFTFNSTSSDDSSEDDEFFTPPSSPSLMMNDFDEDIDEYDSFDDSFLPETDVFIEGSEPSKIDRDVYNALKQASSKINPHDFPNIYKWRHTLSFYTEFEQENWASPKPGGNLGNLKTSTPCKINANLSFNSPASPKSWFRITGLNSPRASLNMNRTRLSFNE